jgi:hypothetical protein
MRFKLGLNIIDAVKSGKTCISMQNGYLHRIIPGETHTFTKQDLTADWEIEERKIYITERDFDQIIDEVNQMWVVSRNSTDEIKRRLFEK